MESQLTDAFYRHTAARLRKYLSQLESKTHSMGEAVSAGRKDKAYTILSELAACIELLEKDLREDLILLHQDLQNAEILPLKLAYPFAEVAEVFWADQCLHLIFPEMLPFPIKGPVYYLHEQVGIALDAFIKASGCPVPIFEERCAIVFLHHYGCSFQEMRHLRDYDNVEHRCITNVLASKAIWGDNPRCMIAMDVLAPGDHNYTEVRVMPLPKFREFVMSEEIEHLP